MKLLVTGHDGFVGTALGRLQAIVPLADGERAVDLRDATRVTDVVAAIRPDAVIHLAAQSFVPRSFEDPVETYDVNFRGTLNLLGALRRTGFAGRFLFVGSGDCYGLVPEDRLPVVEIEPLRPRNPYAVSKVAAEALCYQWSQTEGLDAVMTRSFNHIGPGQSERFVVSDFARQVVAIRLGRAEPVIRTGDIDAARDFSDVRDVVAAYLRLLERGRRGEVYNVCSGVARPVRSLLERMLMIAGVDARVEVDAARLRPAEQRSICGSNRKLREDTGWQPAFAMERSLADILDDWEEKLR